MRGKSHLTFTSLSRDFLLVIYTASFASPRSFKAISTRILFSLMDMSEKTVHNNSVTIERVLNSNCFSFFDTKESLGGKGLCLGKKNGAVVFFVLL